MQLGSGDGSMVLNRSVLVGSESISQPNVSDVKRYVKEKNGDNVLPF